MAELTVWQPDPEVPLGRFADWLTAAGVTVDLVPLWAEAPRPAADGLLVLGGRMDAHAESEHPWLPGVRRILADTVAAGTPTLGICLGHQILAEALGGEVTVAHPHGREQGAAELVWEPAAREDPVLGTLAAGPAMMPMSHQDVVTTLPPGAVELARTNRYPHQAFRVGSALGVQFHPEASPEMVGHWATLTGGDPLSAEQEMRRVDERIAPGARLLAESFAAQLE